ncbi:MAG: ABC transporter substrate-binding protein [Treponema sp.]|jgi:hypothetical protein|nr:ABC transporter substrate-binding protein [Treponema sp.]
MKKLVAAVMAAAMVSGAFVSCKKNAKVKSNISNGGKVLNIYCWNDEFKTRFDTYVRAEIEAKGVTVNFIQAPNQDGVYRQKLDAALEAASTAKAEDKIDMFLVEADYALAYVDTPFTVPVKDLGITDSDLANQFKYTKDIMTDGQGVLKGVSWQGCPGGFCYRRSIAKAVLGTDEPEEVQKALSDWDKFDKVAADAKAKGYFMLSGFDDAFRVFSDNVKTPWVTNKKITMDPMIKRWIDQTKTYTDKGYNNKASLWSAESTKGMAKNGKVFGYFGPAWFIDFCMNKEASGDWAFCNGPMGFSWGGTWICAANGTDNADEIKTIMKKLTCDKDTMVRIAKEYNDFTNNEPAMNEVAADPSYHNEFLGGQNHMAFFVKSAASIKKENITKYDQECTEEIMAAMSDYFNGLVDYDTALNNFYDKVEKRCPGVTR